MKKLNHYNPALAERQFNKGNTMKKQLIASALLMTSMAANAAGSSGIKVQHWLDFEANPVGCTLDVYKGGKGFSLEGNIEDGLITINMTDALGDWNDLLTEKELKKLNFALKSTGEPLNIKDVSKHMRHHEQRLGTVNEALKAFKTCMQGESHAKEMTESDMHDMVHQH